MARYHLSWEVVESRLPSSPQEIAQGWGRLVELTKADLENGKLKEWGAFPGERKGYGVLEGNDRDVLHLTLQYAPFVKFTVRPLTDIRTVEEFVRSMSTGR